MRIDWPALFEKAWLENWQAQRICLLCHRTTPSGQRLCPDCIGDLPANSHPCAHCAVPLPPHRGLVCGRCLGPTAAITPRVRAPYRYAPPVDFIVQRLKFGGSLPCAPAMAELLFEHLRAERIAAPDLIVPVPLHPRRLRERGFNQALEIAKPLARWLRRPLDHRCCIRTRHTERQSGLAGRERRRNVRGAFLVYRPLGAQRVVIIDDVVTTGSTVGELTRVLIGAGATEVEVWAFARAIPG